MSTTIDNRVVEMQFDNRQFERNVETSMSTLGKLKQSLNLTGAAKGLESVGSAAKGINLSGIGVAAETVGIKFNALYTIADQALRNITNSAVNAGKKIVSALTVDPVKTGFQEYETQINAIQTILSNTRSKGTTLDDVNGALDELNTYADKTIYNFTEMTRNIGTFTAAGVDLDTSVNSIKGIANLAAVSGSTSQQASTAMYQLSQALAAGKVSLMDWNSVVNAGMGGQVFQDALKRTAKNLGYNVDAMIEKYGSFRESLTKGNWLTSEVLTETLSQLAGAYSEADLIAKGYTEKQAKEIIALSEDAEAAATKVKTFTQLWDTLKEAAQSGWTQSWEIIVGDFEEARSMLTKVSDVIGGIIGKSAEARNALLQGWKDNGGRDDLIQSFKNIFTALQKIIRPIKDAFREIFPPVTVDQLVKFTEGFKNLTEKLKLSGTQLRSVKMIFKGVFALVDIGRMAFVAMWDAVKPLVGEVGSLGGMLLKYGESLGRWIVKLRDSVKESNVFSNTLQKVSGIIQDAIKWVVTLVEAFHSKIMSPGWTAIQNIFERLRERLSSVSEVASTMKDSVVSAFEDLGNLLEKCSFFKVLETLWNGITKLGSALVQAFGTLTGGLFDKLGVGNFNGFLDTINTLIAGGVGVGIVKFLNSVTGTFKSFKDVASRIVDVFDGVRGCFEAYQSSLKAETLMKIAKAIAILVAAILVVSLIDSDKLSKSLGAVTLLFADLMGSMAIFSKFSGDFKGVTKACIAMQTLATSLLILAISLKIMSTMSWQEMGVGLISMTVGLGALVGAVNLLPDTKVTKAATAIKKMSSAILILAVAIKIMSTMSWQEMGVGLISMVVGLGALVAAVNLIPKDMSIRAIGMISLATAMVILGAALKIMSTMSWQEMGVGLISLAGSLAAITLAMNFMKNALPGAAAMLIVAPALLVLAGVLKIFATMSWAEIAAGLVALGGSLLIMAGAMALMKTGIPGAAAMLVMSAALSVFTPQLLILGTMSWTSIAKGLVALAGAFAVIGVAGLLLSPIVPSIIGLAAAFALIGVGAVAVGAGLTLIATGFSLLATALSTGAVGVTAALTVIVTGLLGLIPMAATVLAEGVVRFAQVIADGAPVIGEAVKALILTAIDVLVECIPAIADGALQLIVGVLDALVTYTPTIVNLLFDFIIGAIESLADRTPELIQAAFDFVMSIFTGVTQALAGMDTSTLVTGIVGVGIMAGIMTALSAVAALVPGAMIGVLGIGAVIAEMAIVLAAIGGLAQIPGLDWLIGEGGQLLQSIGTAIGQFVGGLVGGIAAGVTSVLPQIGSDLSMFMLNAMPFIVGVKMVDSMVLESATMLARAIIAITGAELLAGITSFLTGGTSFAEFGSQLGSLGTSLRVFASNLGNFDDAKVTTINCAVRAVKAIADVANTLPNEGGWLAKLVGDNSIATFGGYLPGLGTNLSSFATNLGTFSDAQVTTIDCAANAIKAMATAADQIPNEGGWAAKLFGDNSIATFSAKLPEVATNLNAFATNLGTFTDAQVTTVDCAATAITVMAKASEGIDGQADWAKKIFGDNGLAAFSSEMPTLGTNLSSFAKNLGTFNADKVATVKSSVQAIDALSGLAKADLKSAKKNIEGFGDKIVEFATDISDFCKNMPSGESVTSATKNLQKILDIVTKVGAVDDGAATKFTKALNELGKKGVDSFVKAFTNDSAKTDVKKAAAALVSKAIDGAESKLSAIKKAFKTIASDGAEAIKEKQSSFYKAGAYLVDGFTNGISENSYKAAAKARAMATAAKKAAEEALGIASPSKVFYRIGAFTGEGFVNALDDYGRDSYKAGSNIANLARNGLTEAVSRIGDIVNGDIDMQPTIRPVLDLSDVESGASAISNMFGGDASVGVLANVGTISSMMNRRSQNGDNFEVVHAIDKLRKEMANVDRASYNINGISYNDDREVSDAIKTLVRHVKIEGRT